MIQISILSGKGGSGKTSICAALIDLIAQEYPLTLVDADVDASNLDLIIPCKKQIQHDFTAGQIARIEKEQCIQCGICETICRFHAIEQKQGPFDLNTILCVNPLLCEGCAVCAQQCPQAAITMCTQQDGVWYQSQSEHGTFFHAHLFAGHENSGKLVSTIISAAHQHAQSSTSRIILVDGPPGIGCPVIAACNQSDLIIIVTEPTPSGIYDMQRMLDTTSNFKIPAFIIINKSDLHPHNTMKIVEVCRQRNIHVLGEIPFDPQFNQAMIHAQPITQFSPRSLSSESIQKIWHNLKEQITF